MGKVYMNQHNTRETYRGVLLFVEKDSDLQTLKNYLYSKYGESYMGRWEVSISCINVLVVWVNKPEIGFDILNDMPLLGIHLVNTDIHCGSGDEFRELIQQRYDIYG